MSCLNNTKLILGSNGFIGNALKKSLSGDVQALSGTKIRSEDFKLYLRELNPKHVIIALGSYTNEFCVDFENNVVSVNRILFMVKEIEEIKPVITVFGSAAEYGNRSGPVSVKCKLQPCTPYGLSKVLLHEVVKSYRRMGLVINYLRLFNIYGKGMSSDLVIGKLYENITNKTKLVQFGDLSSKRDYVPISELCRFVSKIVDSDGLNNDFNVGTGKLKMTRELIDDIIQEEKSDIKYSEEKQFINRRSCGAVYAADYNKI